MRKDAIKLCLRSAIINNNGKPYPVRDLFCASRDRDSDIEILIELINDNIFVLIGKSLDEGYVELPNL